jgi:succinate-semialdehyde dehydrogenase / glutarate-semialdehyde dehydrogenase
MKIRNPRTGAFDYDIAPATSEDLDALASTLRVAQPAWAALTFEQRGSAMRSVAAAITRHSAAIIAALTLDTGRAKISAIEVSGAVRLIERWAGSAEDIVRHAQTNHRETAVPGITTSTRLVPYPLIGVISPWNFPLTLALIDAVPALMAGCAVIVKPSEVTPRFIRPLMAALAEVPEVPLTVIEGDGATGAALIPQVDFIAFTGSVKTGRAVGRAAADAFIPASLELGGKDPMIILASADPVHAATIALRASIINSGQACQSIERVYVARAIAAPFMASLVEQARAVRLNHPDIAVGDIGPFISAQQAEIVQMQIDDAIAKGAICVAGGLVETLDGGKYLRPTVLTGVTPGMAVIDDETFGPVIPVTLFDTVDEAVALANAGVFGLSGAVLAATLGEAESVGARLNLGGVSLNDGSLTSMVWEAEKSSFGLSGMGPGRMGETGLLRFFRRQALIYQSGTALPLSAYAEDGG